MEFLRTLTHAPGRTVMFSIALTICVGTILLMLPIAQTTPIAPLDCFFTATSATCVTGLLTVPFEHFSRFGQWTILALIQIGGIGLLTLWLFIVALFFNLGISTQFMIGRILELSAFKKPRSILTFIIIVTLLAETAGALAILPMISDLYSPSDAAFHAIFHSVSTFCNAGLSSFGPSSLVGFRHNLPFLGVTGLLIFFGGIGFITLHELYIFFKHKIHGKHYQCSLTTKVILSTTSILIVSATLFLLIIEGPTHLQGNFDWWEVLGNMLFNAIAYRSVGLTTIDIDTMQSATVFLIMMYSFIGSSPVSTGSGIKVTTFALCLATIRSVINGSMVVNLKGRRIPQDQIFKAMAVLTVCICWVTISTFFLALAESQSKFIDVFFEAVSSFTNLGLATSITPALSIAGKCIVIMNMFMGRLGILTIMLALRTSPERVEFQYPEERLMIS